MVTVSRQENCKSLAYYGIGLCRSSFKSSKTPFHFSMPPRTRNAGRGRLVALGLPINTSGLPSLPVEILEETLSHLSDVPVPLTEIDALPCTYLERNNALLALSETFSSLPSALFSRPWQHLEVCSSSKLDAKYVYKGRNYRQAGYALWGTQISKDFAHDLVWQMETITVRNPALASHVR
jgi:hypothetical protein